jgi:DNA polymerase-3 subunit beta
MQFSISHDTVKALLVAAAKKDVRYYLNGVCIDVRATDIVAVATNGHILVALPLATDSPIVLGQYIVPRDLLDNLKPAYKGAQVTLTIDPAAKTVSVNVGGSSTTTQLVDGTFPQWRRVVPRVVSGKVSQFDADYIAAFGKINTLLGSKYSPAIAHNGGSENLVEGAARVLLTGEAIGVIMPMRYENPTIDNPSWLDADPAATVAAAA